MPNTKWNRSFHTFEKAGGLELWNKKQGCATNRKLKLHLPNQYGIDGQNRLFLLVDNTPSPQFRYLTHNCFLALVGGNFLWSSFQIPREDFKCFSCPWSSLSKAARTCHLFWGETHHVHSRRGGAKSLYTKLSPSLCVCLLFFVCLFYFAFCFCIWDHIFILALWNDLVFAHMYGF